MSKILKTKHYKKSKGRCQKKACERYQDLFEELENKNHQMVAKKYKSLPEDKTQRVVE